MLALGFAIAACSGGDDTGKAARTGRERAPATGAASGDPVTRVAENAAEVTSCLDLVKQQKWPTQRKRRKTPPNAAVNDATKGLMGGTH